jgi:hypothetical protein
LESAAGPTRSFRKRRRTDEAHPWRNSVHCLVASCIASERIFGGHATLTLPHNDVLPGVPFDLIVTYTNVSDEPITIDTALATLVVTFANGDTVVMHWPEGHDQSDIQGSMPARLDPGECVQHAASWAGGIPNWFRYGSFSGPGTYGIALDLRIEDRQGRILGAVRTPTVTLTRIDPVGIDAELWKRMQEVSGGRWSDSSFKTTKEGAALSNEIIRLNPASGYYPYALSLRAFEKYMDKNHIPALLEAAERFTNSPAYPYLLVAAAHCALYAGTVAMREGNMAEATKYYKLAETKFRGALATKSVAIRASSERGLLDVASGMEQATRKSMQVICRIPRPEGLVTSDSPGRVVSLWRTPLTRVLDDPAAIAAQSRRHVARSMADGYGALPGYRCVSSRRTECTRRRAASR